MKKEKVAIKIIAAMSRDNCIIGNNGKLPSWKIKEDMARFRKLTTGHPVIMGRKTWDSLDKYRPLPNRANIVVTRQTDYVAPGAAVVHSLEEAIGLASSLDHKEIYVIGGEEIYRQGLRYADVMHLTYVEGEFEGDTFFPGFDPSEWEEVLRRESSNGNYRYWFVDYERV